LRKNENKGGKLSSPLSGEWNVGEGVRGTTYTHNITKAGMGEKSSTRERSRRWTVLGEKRKVVKVSADRGVGVAEK